MEYARAKSIADRLVDVLAPACERIEIAGGVRRRKAQPHDIEIVCVPRVEPQYNLTRDTIGVLYPINSALAQIGRQEKGGDRAKQFLLPEGIYLDLYLVLPPAQWGVIYTLRTGPADYSRWLVTARRQGGACPSFLKVRHGQVWNADEALPVPEEADFFRLLELPWTEPEQRCPPTRRCAEPEPADGDNEV